MQPAHEIDPDIELSFEIKQAMHDLKGKGYWLHPLGGGDDGKRPSAKMYENPMPLQAVYDCMVRNGREMYGIRCPDLVVVDLDNRRLETLRYAEERFGYSLFRVKTARGEHWYYRLGDAAPKTSKIRKGLVAIDVKHGPNDQVVGPGSVRPDTGDQYETIGDLLPPIGELPVFQDRHQKPGKSNFTHPPKVVDISGSGVVEGERFDTLKAKAREIVRNVSSQHELFDALVEYVNATFENPETFERRKIEQVAEWTWRKRQEGNLWGGANSPVQILPHEVAALDNYSNGPEALRLLWDIRHNHAAQPGKRFALATHAMARDNVIDGWSEWTYRRARNTLLEVGLIKKVVKGKGKQPHLYQLHALPLSAD